MNKKYVNSSRGIKKARVGQKSIERAYEHAFQTFLHNTNREGHINNFLHACIHEKREKCNKILKKST